MSTKSKKRAAARAEKLRRKRERFARGGRGKSRYAQKQRGAELKLRTELVWCPGRFRRVCGCEPGLWAKLAERAMEAAVRP